MARLGRFEFFLSCSVQVNVSQAWGILAAIFIIIMPLVYEGLDIWRAVRSRRRAPAASDAAAAAQAPQEMTLGSSEALNGSPVTHVKLEGKEDVVYVL